MAFLFARNPAPRRIVSSAFPNRLALALALALVGLSAALVQADEAEVAKGLLGHWPLAGDARDVSGQKRDAEVHGAVGWGNVGEENKQRSAARFPGSDAYLEIPAAVAPQLGKQDFTLSLWVHTAEPFDDLPGDLASQYDSAARRGWHLTLKTNSGITFSQANDRCLQFGVDDDRQTEWLDCGRPGEALIAFALAVHDGELYAGTCEPGPNQSGRVYRYAGGQQWIECGRPDASNSVTSLAQYDGHLYAGTGKYRVAGSALPESENTNLGGRIFRLEGDQWVSCGRLPEAEAVGGLVVFQGKLYASSLYKPAGFYRYEGGETWKDCGVPEDKRVEAMGVYNGHLYATSYDGGRVYRYDGSSWTDCGQLGDNTQTYSISVYHGRLYVGTWPSGRVYRFEELGQWTDVGRLGEELEVMGMLVHNGRLIAGTLPLAEVYQYAGADTWKRLARLDHTPEVKYRRAWTMAEYGGKLFCSTLPSGKVYSFEAGTNASWDRTLPAGWHHVAAVRQGTRLRLLVDGKQVSEAAAEDLRQYDLSSGAPLRIGFGSNDYFRGALADVRLYDRALEDAALKKLAE